MAQLPGQSRGEKFKLYHYQHVDPMPGQDYYLRPDEALRPQPPVEHGGGELPPQTPAGDPDELAPSVIPSAVPGSRTP
jgi:hypothetical protein